MPLPDLLGGEERLEDLAQVLRRDADAGVGDRDAHAASSSPVGARRSASPPVGHRRVGVADEVGQHLDDLVAVELGDRVRRVVVLDARP